MKPWAVRIIVFIGLALFAAGVIIQTGGALSRYWSSRYPVVALSPGQTPIISVDFSRETSVVSDKIFGEGLEMPFLDNVWNKDSGFDQTTLEVAKAIRFTNLRFGGATCRDYNWKNQPMTGYRPYQKLYWEGIDQWHEYAKLLNLPSPTICTNIHLAPSDSADWVRYANIEKGYDIINWEMGNEEYLAYANVDVYLRDARAHCDAMKAVDARVRCGIVGDEKGLSWTNAQLLAKLRPGEFDFFVSHFYEPEGYFNYYSLYTAETKYERKLSLAAGRYTFSFKAIGDLAPSAANPYPTLKVCLDKDCDYVDVKNRERGSWVDYSTRRFDVKAGSHTLAVSLAEDYFNWANKEDKNLFVSQTKLTADNGSVTQVEMIDSKTWTYSFLASNLATEDSIKEIRNLMKQSGLNLPIYITEYGWSYGTEAYPSWGKQYDWRSTLFDVLAIQSLIKEAIPQANIWNDLSTGYWKYFSSDVRGQTYWPIFSVFKLLSEKTGSVLVETKLENVPTYDAKSIHFLKPDRINVPYLSVVSSKRGDKAYINVVNRSQDGELSAILKTNIDYDSVKVSEVAPSTIEAHPYREDQFRENITVQEKTLKASDDFTFSFKPHSVTTFEFNVTSPIISASKPVTAVFADRAEATIKVTTDKAADCRYDTAPNLNFDQMKNQLVNAANGVEHTTTLNGLKSGEQVVSFVKCQNLAGATNLNDYPIVVSVPAAPAATACLISPDGGNFFRPAAVTLTCGRAVTAANFSWDNGPATKLNLSAITVFAADKKRTLNLTYRYKQGAVEKTVKVARVFDANQRWCNVNPNGGSFSRETNVSIECGDKIKRSSWRWDRGEPYNFSPSTNIKFTADFSKTLTVSFAYDQMVAGKLQEKVTKFTKNFQVPQCLDSDNGKKDQAKGTLLYTGKTIKRSYTDSCSGDTLTEYYCDKNALMAFVKVKCPGGCSDGRCAVNTAGK